MKPARVRSALVVVLFLVCVSPAGSCPVCQSETGQRVRAGLFNDDFVSNLVQTLLPFPVLLGIIALIHFGVPWTTPDPRRRTPPEPSRFESAPDHPAGDPSWITE